MTHRTHDTLSNIRCWLLDMDGTITLGEALLPGAKDFFTALGEDDYIFMTNNSAHSAAHYMKRMRKLGIPTDREQIMTSTDALALHLKANGSKGRSPRVFAVGTPDFVAELQQAGIEVTAQKGENIDHVVLGFDTTLTYEKLSIACDYIRSGVTYLAANPDLVCPMPQGKVLPDCGAIIAFMQACTGQPPARIIGKPNAAMVDVVVKSRGYRRSELAMVGDRLYTDLAVAKNAGIIGIAVLSGEASAQDIRDSDIHPDFVFQDVGDLAQAIQKNR